MKKLIKRWCAKARIAQALRSLSAQRFTVMVRICNSEQVDTQLAFVREGQRRLALLDKAYDKIKNISRKV